MTDKIVAGEMFEKASRIRPPVRFTFKGVQTTESLWDLSIEDLDSIYKDLIIKSKAASQESLLNKKSNEDKVLDLQIEIVKYIVQEKQIEAEKRLKNSENRKQLQKLLAIRSEAEDSKLKSMSTEELDKLIENLQSNLN